MLVKKSSGSVRLIAIDRDALFKSLREISAAIKTENTDVMEINIFGSIAMGDETGTSDLDILVILSRSDEPLIFRSARFRRYFDIAVPMDILVYTRD